MEFLNEVLRGMGSEIGKVIVMIIIMFCLNFKKRKKKEPQ